MTKFTALLLAWPFYLAVNGRLSTYINLAKPNAQTPTTGQPASIGNKALNLALDFTGLVG